MRRFMRQNSDSLYLSLGGFTPLGTATFSAIQQLKLSLTRPKSCGIAIALFQCASGLVHKGRETLVAEAAAKEKEEAQAPERSTVNSSGDQGQKPMLLVIVLVLNMLLMAAVVGIVYTSYKAEKNKPKLQDVVQGEKEDTAKTDTPKEDEDVVGKLVPMETFLVNLAGTRGNKLVKINMELEVNNPKVEDEIDHRKPQIRDIIIILLSSKTYDQVTTRQGKEALRDEVKDTVNSFLVKGKIKKVYFTDFIVN
jgi:flagellar FliL protein